MRIAVVTPYLDEPLAWLRRCHDSVRTQTRPATHFLVADGRPQAAVADWDCQHIALPAGHEDWGNTPRMTGGLSAASQGFDAVLFLDADDWYRPDHVATVAGRIERGDVDVVVSDHVRHRVDGTPTGRIHQGTDGEAMTASTFAVARTGFSMLAIWAMVPRPVARFGPHWIFLYLRARDRMVRRARGATVLTTARDPAANAGVVASLAHLVRDPAPAPAVAVETWWNTLDDDRRDTLRRMQGIV